MLSCLVYPTSSEKPFNQFVTEHSARTNAMPLEPFLAGDLSLRGRFQDLEADSKILLKSWNSRSAHSACSRSFPGPEIPRPSGSHCNSSFLHYMTPPLPSEDICICCKHEPGFTISPGGRLPHRTPWASHSDARMTQISRIMSLWGWCPGASFKYGVMVVHLNQNCVIWEQKCFATAPEQEKDLKSLGYRSMDFISWYHWFSFWDVLLQIQTPVAQNPTPSNIRLLRL